LLARRRFRFLSAEGANLPEVDGSSSSGGGGSGGAGAVHQSGGAHAQACRCCRSWTFDYPRDDGQQGLKRRSGRRHAPPSTAACVGCLHRGTGVSADEAETEASDKVRYQWSRYIFH
jgi:hypothetical protein